jgi:hypothetical protein
MRAPPSAPPTPPRFAHAEAFMVMLYESEDGRVAELVWNSRDGVTPFCIRSMDGRAELRHARWEHDMRRPWHVPLVGSRVFVDVTPARAEEMARAQVDRYWDTPEVGMKHATDLWKTPEEAVARLAENYLGDGHAPDLVIVDEALHRRFAEAHAAAFARAVGPR